MKRSFHCRCHRAEKAYHAPSIKHTSNYEAVPVPAIPGWAAQGSEDTVPLPGQDAAQLLAPHPRDPSSSQSAHLSAWGAGPHLPTSPHGVRPLESADTAYMVVSLKKPTIILGALRSDRRSRGGVGVRHSASRLSPHPALLSSLSLP